MAGNGLKSFSFHVHDPAGAEVARLLDEGRPGLVGFQGPGLQAVQQVDPSTVARQYLEQALASPAVPQLTAVKLAQTGDPPTADFRLIGTETIPFTGTRAVKFRQTFNRIAVYGSQVYVELDPNNELLSITSAVGQPDVNPVAKVSPFDALNVVFQHAGQDARLPNRSGRLYFYYDTESEPDGRWHLAYVFEDVQPSASAHTQEHDDGGMGSDLAGEGPDVFHPPPLLFDYVVDAHDGRLLAKLPRTATTAEEVEGPGGTRISIRVRQEGDNQYLHDEHLNVHTYDAGFADVSVGPLPGEYCVNPPSWSAAAVSAHVHAAVVASFLREVLRRNGIDNAGGRLVSSVNCVDRRSTRPGSQEWPNAAWIGTQMVYGQRYDHQRGVLRSYAEALDVVAHEVFHGVTSHTARLQYQGEPGALNESYSDIFGILISNWQQPDRTTWNWTLGEDLVGGVPIRNLSDPTEYGQPDHMRDYARLPLTRGGDYGGVHKNSGIHNKAAHLVMTTRDADGGWLFGAEELARLFYLPLLQGLGETSGFAVSRLALERAVLTLFPAEARQVRVQAVQAAFDTVGVMG